MNLPGHPIAARLGKAALKTHALQTLTRPSLTRPRARSVWSASDLSALSVQRGTASGSWLQCTISESRTPDIEPSENVRFFLRSPRERRSADATVSLEKPLPSGSVLRRELRWHEYDALN